MTEIIPVQKGHPSEFDNLLLRKAIDALEREDKAGRIPKEAADLIKQAPNSIAIHAQLIHKNDVGEPIIPARHQEEWVRILEDRERYRWVCIIAPPGYAKSTWFSLIYPTWRIGVTGGNIRIGLISKTATAAHSFSNSIRETIVSERFRETYPEVQPNESRPGWTKEQLYFTNTPEGANPSLFAVGIGSQTIQGRRFDEIIVDDPVNWDDVRSETIMDGLRHWFKSLLLQRFPPGKGPPEGDGRMVVVLTRWGERDLVPTLADLGFTVVTMPALGYWDKTIHEDGEVEWGSEPLWPEKESREFLLAEKEDDPIIFQLVKQGDPTALAGDMFDQAWFQRGRPPAVTDFEQIVQYVDTAGGKDRRRGDFFALATVGIRKDGQEVWILDMERHKGAAPEQERSVLKEYEEWRDMGHAPDLVVIEDANEGRALYQRLVTSTRLPLKDYTPVKDKEWRAIPLANAYRAMRVWHPEGEKWVRSYEAELMAFSPTCAHDDQVDAASGAFAHTVAPGPRLRTLR